MKVSVLSQSSLPSPTRLTAWALSFLVALPMLAGSSATVNAAEPTTETEEGTVDEGTDDDSEDAVKVQAYLVRLKLPGGDTPVDAPTVVKMGTPEKWDIVVDGQHHIVRLHLRHLDDTSRVQAELRYDRGETSVVDTTTELSVASWLQLETNDGSAFELWVDPKKHNRIKLPEGDDPLDGL